MQSNEKRVDNKHSIYTDENGEPFLAKRLESGELQPIPPEEPVIVFRGRDGLALPMLQYYREMCIGNRCTDYQLNSLDDMIRRFREFADTSGKMKRPGSTRGM